MDTIGGFRLVRRLGSGGRAEVHLGHSMATSEEGAARSVAVKVFRPTTPLVSIDEEVDALARLSSPYLLPLLDLAITDDGRPVLILERLAQVTCSRLILEREHLTAGEAVTILAPMADAVGELSRVGVVHGGIRLDRVGFDGVGTPVLMGFGHARVIGPVPLDGEHRAESLRTGDDGPRIDGRSRTVEPTDSVALAAVARSVLSAIRPTPESTDLTDWLAAPIGDPSAFRTELRDRLFDLTAPEPVVVERAQRRAIAAVEPTPVDGAARETARDPADGAPDWLAATHLPAWVQAMLPISGPTPVRSLVDSGWAAVRRFLAPVRRPVWLVAGGVAVLLTVALVIAETGIAGEARAAAGPDGRPIAATSSPTTDRPVEDDSEATEADAPASGSGLGESREPAAPASGSDPGDRGDAGDAAAISGDDVVKAATALLRQRAQCLREQSVLCLDAIEQQGSAALETDTALIRAGQDGGGGTEPLDLTAATPSVVEHLGGTVIVSLELASAPDTARLPASMLLVRGEEGWRIRDLIVG